MATPLTAHEPPPDPDPDPLRRIAVLISGSGTNLQALIDACNTPLLPQSHIVLVLSNRKAAYGLVRAASAPPNPTPIQTAYLALQPFLRAHPGATRVEYDLEVARVVVEARPDVVVLAGWMHIVSEAFLEVLRGARGVPPPASTSESQGGSESAGAGADESGSADCDGSGSEGAQEQEVRTRQEIPVINIHPALPGQFDGANAIERGFEAFQRGEVDKLGVMVHRVIAEVDRGKPIIVREVDVRIGEDLKNDYEPRLHRTEWEIIVEATRTVLDEVKPVGGP